MPAINIYFNNQELLPQLEQIVQPLREFTAKELTCSDIKLPPTEISVRLLPTQGKGMMAPVEMDIFAAAFPERVERQDDICRNVRKFVLENTTTISDVQVWLPLSELGHSFEKSPE
jgi:hypothetical protein